MMELTINEQVYTFNFGLGFFREINGKVTADANGVKDARKLGLLFYVGNIIDGDLTGLEEILLTANKGMNPRLTAAKLEAYLDDPETDTDALCDTVIDFLSRSNSCKKTMSRLMDLLEEQEKTRKN